MRERAKRERRKKEGDCESKKENKEIKGSKKRIKGKDGRNERQRKRQSFMLSFGVDSVFAASRLDDERVEASVRRRESRL